MLHHITRTAWNELVTRAWYAYGCPPRFPLRQIRTTR